MQKRFKGWACDAGTDWTTLRNRLIAFEEFARINPKLPETMNMVLPETSNMFSIFLTGMDNARIIDYRTKCISLHLLNNYREYLTESKSVDRTLVIRELMAAYEATGYTMNDQAKSIIKKATGSEPLY
jgi:hypothetical protein